MKDSVSIMVAPFKIGREFKSRTGFFYLYCHPTFMFELRGLDKF